MTADCFTGALMASKVGGSRRGSTAAPNSIGGPLCAPRRILLRAPRAGRRRPKTGQWTAVRGRLSEHNALEHKQAQEKYPQRSHFEFHRIPMRAVLMQEPQGIDRPFRS